MTTKITEADIHAAQEAWAESILTIARAYSQGDDYKRLAAKHVNSLYAYDQGTVLFKPTMASKQQFRLTEEDAISYFVTGIVPEDTGFAIKPWSKIRFENCGIIIHTDCALAMGNYFFTNADSGAETKVEYTFGYVMAGDGNLRINMHHSSLSFNPAQGPAHT